MARLLVRMTLSLFTFFLIETQAAPVACHSLAEPGKPSILSIKEDMDLLSALAPYLDGAAHLWQTDLDNFFFAFTYYASALSSIEGENTVGESEGHRVSKISNKLTNAIKFIESLEANRQAQYAREIAAIAILADKAEAVSNETFQSLHQLLSSLLQSRSNFTPSQVAGLLFARMICRQAIEREGSLQFAREQVLDLVELSKLPAQAISRAFELKTHFIPLQIIKIHHILILNYFYLVRKKEREGSELSVQLINQFLEVLLGLGQPYSLGGEASGASPVMTFIAREFLKIVAENPQQFKPQTLEMLQGLLITFLPPQILNTIPELPHRERFNPSGRLN